MTQIQLLKNFGIGFTHLSLGFGLEDQVLGLGQCVLDPNPDVNSGWLL